MAWFGGILQIAFGGLGIPLALLSFAFTFEFAILGHLAGSFLGLASCLVDLAFRLVRLRMRRHRCYLALRGYPYPLAVMSAAERFGNGGRIFRIVRLGKAETGDW